MNSENSKLFKQRLFSLHSHVGITISIFFYISLFFGTFTIFLPYIQVWEKPSRHFEVLDTKHISYSQIINSVVSDPNYPKNNIFVTLPGFKNDPTIKVSHQFVETKYFNPLTQKEIIDEKEKSYLAEFINKLHTGRAWGLIPVLLFGFMSVGVMFLIIGGLLLINYLKFKNNGKNQQSTFSKWHRKILIFTFFPLLMISLSGALMNIGYKSAQPMTYILTKGDETNFFKLTNPVLLPKEKVVISSKINANMVSINQLIEKAKKINPQVTFYNLQLINWNDKNARLELTGYNPYIPFLNGTYNKPKIIFNAVDGSIIKDERVLERSWSILLSDSVYFLHLLYNVDIVSRTFIALLMLFSTIAIGFGVMLWLEKKAKVFDTKITFYHWMGKFSLATMIGVIPATAVLFVLQWALPFNLEHRVLIQQVVFYNFWIATLMWSFYRINSYQAAKEFLFLGGILFILAAIVHLVISGFSPIELFQQNMVSILGVDIVLVALGILLICIALILPKKREEAKIFWNKKYQRIIK